MEKNISIKVILISSDPFGVCIITIKYANLNRENTQIKNR
jgi:hypothetical protein